VLVATGSKDEVSVRQKTENRIKQTVEAINAEGGQRCVGLALVAVGSSGCRQPGYRCGEKEGVSAARKAVLEKRKATGRVAGG
jgi:hypothetical protein